MSEKLLNDLTRKIIKFRNTRDWKNQNNPKDIAISISLEASELLEHFQWKNEKEVKEYLKTNKDAISHEIADIFIYIVAMSSDLEIDIMQAVENKLAILSERYPAK